MLAWLGVMVPAFSVGRGGWEQVCAVAAWGMAQFIYVLDVAGMVLTSEQATGAHDAGQAYLTAYSWLANDALSHGKLQYKLRPKLHAFQHVLIRLKEHMLKYVFVARLHMLHVVGRM